MLLSSISKSILESLLEDGKSKNHIFKTECLVQNLSKENDIFIIETNAEPIYAKKVVVASGGISYPQMGATNIAPIIFYEATPTKYREVKFVREADAFRYRKNKEYTILTPTFGEMKTNLKLQLKLRAEQMELFKNKFRREEYLAKLGEVERAMDMGEIESKKYLANKICP